MSVEDWARREAEKRWAIKRDKFGILSREEAAMNAIQRAGFEEGGSHAFSALLSDEAMMGAVDLLREQGHDIGGITWRAALQAAINAVTEGDTE